MELTGLPGCGCHSLGLGCQLQIPHNCLDFVHLTLANQTPQIHEGRSVST